MDHKGPFTLLGQIDASLRRTRGCAESNLGVGHVSDKRWSLLDERLETGAAGAVSLLIPRVIGALGAALLTGFIFEPLFGAAWFVAFGLGEVAARGASHPATAGRSLGPRRRLAHAGAIFLQSAVWASLALRLWISDEEAYRLAAMAVLAMLMVYALSFRSPLGLAVMGAAPAALWLGLPIFFGGYAGLPLITLSVGLSLLLLYLVVSARANFRNAALLAAAEREAVAASAAKSAFLAVVSHEVRTPMNGVLGMARALQRTNLDPQQQRYLETMLRSGETLVSMLNDVLDFSKIEAGRMDLEVQAFDLRAMAGDVIELWLEGAKAKQLDLDWFADDDLPALVLGDETRVRQIVMNLVSNALKFTEAGGVRLEISTAPGADGDGGVEIRVIDTGIGLSPEQLRGLFRPYVQAESSTSRKYGGTGLGLAICRDLAGRMGGTIEVHSEPGQGSTFRVWLPLPAAEAREAEAAEHELLPRLRILVADDNPINQAVARAVLEAAGAVVETAGDGVEALERLRLEAFDVVLMDVHMPNMDGVEAVGRIRDGQAGRADIPVVALTADAMSGEEARLRTLGFDALQHKPVQPAALITAIGDVLAARPLVEDGSEAAA